MKFWFLILFICFEHTTFFEWTFFWLKNLQSLAHSHFIVKTLQSLSLSPIDLICIHYFSPANFIFFSRCRINLRIANELFFFGTFSFGFRSIPRTLALRRCRLLLLLLLPAIWNQQNETFSFRNTKKHNKVRDARQYSSVLCLMNKTIHGRRTKHNKTTPVKWKKRDEFRHFSSICTGSICV